MTGECWHFSSLQQFKEIYFKDIIPSIVLDEEIVIRDERFWSFRVGKKRYLIDLSAADDFPIRIKKTSPFNYRGKVWHVVNEYDKIKIQPEKFKPFRAIVDDIADFKHTNQKHFLLLKLLAMAGYIDRINTRISSEAGFGKDSIYSVLGHLKGDIAIINPKTEAAVEYRLNNKMLVLDELSNLDSARKDLLQELLLQVGDMRNVYQKSSRGQAGSGTYDEYDISQLSLAILFNNCSYYADVGTEHKFFDKVFTKAVLDRYIHFRFDGVLNMKQFKKRDDYKEIAQENTVKIVQMLKSLLWYRENYHTELKNFKKEIWVDMTKGRHQIHMHTILNICDLYANNEEEFEQLARDMVNCYKAYAEQNSAEGNVVVEEVTI